MLIETLTNRIIPIQNILQNELMRCNKCSIASSFIDDTAIAIVENALAKNKNLKELKLLIGIYGCFNRKHNLAKLQLLAGKYAVKCEMHISKDRKFHWKYYNFIKGKKQTLYIGSANFTSGGMDDNGEVLVKLSTNTSELDFGFNSISTRFDKEWEQSGAITEFNLDEYNENPLVKLGENESLIGNKDFFDTPARLKPQKITSTNAVITYLAHSISPKTEKMVGNTKPSWNENNYFICNSKKDFDQCIAIKKILMLQRTDKSTITATWVQYLDNLRLKTPDGNYFISYSYVGKKMKLDRKSLDYIANTKTGFGLKLLGWKNLFGFKVMQKNQLRRLEEFLNSK